MRRREVADVGSDPDRPHSIAGLLPPVEGLTVS